MYAQFTPIAGGSLAPAKAFNILAERLGITEQPISQVRRRLFRFLHDFTQLALQHPDTVKKLALVEDGIEVLADLYEGLADVEDEAQTETCKANLATYLEARALAARQEEAQAGAAG